MQTMSNTTSPPLPHTLLLPPLLTHTKTVLLLLYLYPLPSFLTLTLLYLSTLTLYRLAFHPLRHFPGPTLAKISFLYELYYDLFSPGFTFHAEERLHPKYGKVVRIGPGRLRVADGEVWFQIHSVNSPFTKDPGFYHAFNKNNSIFALLSNKDHRERRALLTPLFKRKSILQLTPLVREKTRLLVERWARDCDNEGGYTKVDAKDGFAALTCDILMEFSFGKSYDILRAEGAMKHPVIETMEAFPSFLPIGKNFPWISRLLESLSGSLINWLAPGAASLNAAEAQAESHIHALLSSPSKPPFITPTPSPTSTPPPLIDSLATTYPSPHDLATDAAVIFTAGMLSTQYTLTFSLHHLPVYQSALYAELLTLYPGGLDELLAGSELEKLEALPLFGAFVKECLRLTYGVAGGLLRVAPRGKDTLLCGLRVPSGTVVATSIHTQHHMPSLFPEPERFWPERWLGKGGGEENRERNLVAFGSGSRMCLGKELALLEIYTVLAGCVLGFEVKSGGEWRWKERRVPVRVGGGGVGLRRRV